MTDTAADEPYRNEPKRDAIRVQPFYLPPSLAGATCAQCKQVPQTKDVHVVHVDRAKDECDQVKAQTFLACSQLCAEELHAGLTVEYGLLGVADTKTSAEAVAVATGADPAQIRHTDDADEGAAQ